MTKGTKNSVRRSSGKTQVTIEWPIEWSDWDVLPGRTRMQIREALDLAVDLIERHAPRP